MRNPVTIHVDGEERELLARYLAEKRDQFNEHGGWPATVEFLDRVLGEIGSPVEERASLIEFHADGRQYLVPDFARDKFLAARYDTERKQIAELVVQNGRVIKNRRGGVA